MPTSNDLIPTLVKYTQALTVALGFRDQSTERHSGRVSGLALELGESCGLSQTEIAVLNIAARLHDVGKIGIPDQILRKPAKLDADEWEIMQRHPLIGDAIIRATDLEEAEQAALAVRHHHERFNGQGYPDGLAGDAIPLPSRIISIVDSYDAMADPRAYHRARSHDAIMDILHDETGNKHDPQLMRIFDAMIGHSELRTSNH